MHIPKSFDLLKLWSQFPEIWAKSLKIWVKSLNIWVKMAPSFCRKIHGDLVTVDQLLTRSNQGA